MGSLGAHSELHMHVSPAGKLHRWLVCHPASGAACHWSSRGQEREVCPFNEDQSIVEYGWPELFQVVHSDCLLLKVPFRLSLCFLRMAEKATGRDWCSA